MHFRLDCKQHHASTAHCIGLAPKVGDVGVCIIFWAAESFCLAATLRCSCIGAWLSGLSFPFDSLLDTAMTDEWQCMYFPTLWSCGYNPSATRNELAFILFTFTQVPKKGYGNNANHRTTDTLNVKEKLLAWRKGF